MKRIMIFFVLVFCFISCDVNVESAKGTLIVSNNSDETFTITEVFVKERYDSGYHLIYTGEILNGKSEFLFLDYGEYSVKISVLENKADVYTKKHTYETGYNVYEKITASLSADVIFDGNGIYFN